MAAPHCGRQKQRKHLTDKTMPLPRKYQNGRYLLQKLLEHAAELEQGVSWPEFNDFAVTAHHLCEWVRQDPAATDAAKRDLEAMSKGLHMQACKDAANSYKHMKIARYTPKTTGTDVEEAGWGVGRYGKGGYGEGEEEVVLSMADGGKFNALDLSRQVAKLWSGFFKKHFPGT
jgi:hypothetical protein